MVNPGEIGAIKRELKRDESALAITEMADWYEQRKCHGAPRWERIWSVAKKVRDNHTYRPRVFEEELSSLTYDAAEYCFRKFDAARGEQKNRTEDRFVQLFMKKLWGIIADTRRRRKLYPKFRRLECDILDPRTNLRKITLLLWVREAVANLPNEDRWLIQRVYWEGQSFSEVASSLGIGKSTVGERHARIIKTLKTDCFGYIHFFDALTDGCRMDYLHL